MGHKEKFNDILNECLERLLVKGETIQQCLQSYPEHAAELEPLLLTSLKTKKALDIQPSADFKARARYQFHAALNEVKAKKAAPRFAWQPRWVVTIVLVVSLFMMAGGTVAAANYSMPDSPLYPVKVATEQAQLLLTPSKLSKAELYARFADKRVIELAYVAEKDGAEEVEVAALRLKDQVTKISTLTAGEKMTTTRKPAPATLGAETPAPPKAPEKTAPPSIEVAAKPDNSREKKESKDESAKERLKTVIKRNAAKHPDALKEILEKAPEEAKPALKKAIDESAARYKEALEALNDDD